MVQKSTAWYMLFLSSLIIAIVSYIGESYWLHLVSKPIIAIALGGYFISKLRTWESEASTLVIVALIFSGLGGIFLILQEQVEFFFLLGAGAYIVTQLSYAWSFKKRLAENHQLHPNQIKKSLKFIIPIAIPSVIFVFYVSYAFKDFFLPVMIYALSLVFLLIMSALRYKLVSKQSFYYAFGGTFALILNFLIICSDFFVNMVEVGEPVFIFLNAAGQWMLIKGIYLDLNEEADLSK